MGKNPFFHKITGKMGREIHPKQWLFIVGCYNSGTTLLHEILAESPEVASLPTEGAFLTGALRTPEEFGWVRMWHKCLDRMIPPDGTEEKTARMVKRNWSVWLDNTRPVVLEKSVSNTARILFLQKHFVPSAFVYIVRNGYAVAEGIRRKADLQKWKTPHPGNRYPIELCARQWVETDRMVESVRNEITRLHVVSYEELVENPEITVRKIYRFAGVQAHAMEGVAGKQYHVTGHHSAIRNMNQESIARLSREDIDRINGVAGDTLKKYGYAVR